MQYFSLFDMAICAVPALAVGAWQLVSVNREIAKDKAAALSMTEERITALPPCESPH